MDSFWKRFAHFLSTSCIFAVYFWTSVGHCVYICSYLRKCFVNTCCTDNNQTHHVTSPTSNNSTSIKHIKTIMNIQSEESEGEEGTLLIRSRRRRRSRVSRRFLLPLRVRVLRLTVSPPPSLFPFCLSFLLSVFLPVLGPLYKWPACTNSCTKHCDCAFGHHQHHAQP